MYEKLKGSHTAKMQRIRHYLELTNFKVENQDKNERFRVLSRRASPLFFAGLSGRDLTNALNLLLTPGISMLAVCREIITPMGTILQFSEEKYKNLETVILECIRREPNAFSIKSIETLCGMKSCIKELANVSSKRHQVIMSLIKLEKFDVLENMNLTSEELITYLYTGGTNESSKQISKLFL